MMNEKQKKQEPLNIPKFGFEYSHMHKFIIALLSLLLLLAPIAQCQTYPSAGQVVGIASADSVLEHANDDASQEEGPWYAAVWLSFILAIVCLTCGVMAIGVCIAIGLLFILFLFTTLGILSASVFAGIRQRSLLSGFKVFLFSITSIGGILSGISIMSFVRAVLHLKMPLNMAISSGAVGGLTGGLILGYLILVIIRWVASKF